MNNKSKTVWGVIFIIFIIASAFGIVYQIITAPKQALAYVASSGQTVYQTDIRLRTSLLNFEDNIGTATEKKELLNELFLEVSDLEKITNDLEDKNSSLTQIEKWALDSYDFNISQRIEILQRVYESLIKQIEFSLDNFEIIKKFENSIDNLKEDNSSLECDDHVNNIELFNDFLNLLETEVIENTTNLLYQKSIYDYIDYWEGKNAIILDTISSKNCLIEEVDFLSDELVYNYYPQSRLYITGTYINNLETVTGKIESLIDKL